MAGGTFNHTTKQIEFRLYKWNTRQPFPPRDIITYHPTIEQYSTEPPPPPPMSTHVEEQIRRTPHDVTFELTQTLQGIDAGELITIYKQVPTPTHRLPNDPGPLPDTVSREDMLEHVRFTEQLLMENRRQLLLLGTMVWTAQDDARRLRRTLQQQQTTTGTHNIPTSTASSSTQANTQREIETLRNQLQLSEQERTNLVVTVEQLTQSLTQLQSTSAEQL